MLAGRLSTKTLVGITGTGPVGARGAREGWGCVTDGACVCLPVCSNVSCVNAVRKQAEGALLPGGSKSGEKFSQVTQEAVFLF